MVGAVLNTAGGVLGPGIVQREFRFSVGQRPVRPDHLSCDHSHYNFNLSSAGRQV